MTSRDVLVLRALGLGDLLTAVPALRGLRRALPDARIALGAPAALGELLPMIGAVDALRPTPDMRRMRWSGPPPDVAVNLHGRGPESIAALRATGAPDVRTHAHPQFPDLDGPQWNESVHEVVRWCEMLRHWGIRSDPDDLALHPPQAASPRPGAAVLHPGAAHPARRWPPERFAAVAAELAAHGHEVVLTGTRAERPAAEQVAELAGLRGDPVLAGRTGLAELAALVRAAAVVVCGDTGTGHLASAFGTPSVLLFGPVPPARWGPPDRGRHVVLWNGTTGDPFADRPDPGLLALPAERVAEAALDVLGAKL